MTTFLKSGLNDDGTLDSNFNPNPNGWVSIIFALHNGKALVSGNFTTIAANTKAYLAQLNSDGSLDSNFIGVASHPAEAGAIHGNLYYNIFLSDATWDSQLSSLLPDGTPDPNFTPFSFEPSYHPDILNYTYYFYGLTALSDYPFLIYSGDPPSAYPDLSHSGVMLLNGLGGYEEYVIPGGLFSEIWKGSTVTHDGSVLAYGYNLLHPIQNNQPNGRYYRSEILEVTNSNTRIQWQRLGFCAQAQKAVFSLSTDNGTTWSPLGAGQPLGGDVWELSNLSLPASGLIRVRASTLGGYRGMSQGIVETIAPLEQDLIISGRTTYSELNDEIIVDGAADTTEETGTHFGQLITTSPNWNIGKKQNQFTLTNKGATPVTISSIAISGSHSGDFTLSDITLPVTLGGLQSTHFKLTFNPSANGFRSATVTVLNDQSNKSNYDFSLGGEGVEQSMEIAGNGVTIAPSDTTPNLTDHTDFGTPVLPDSTVVRTFEIRNTGTARLEVNNIQISNGASFSVAGIPLPFYVDAGYSMPFEVTFTPLAQGAASADVRISSDFIPNPYFYFSVQGTATADISLQGAGNPIPYGSITPSSTNKTDVGSVLYGSGQNVTSYTIQNVGTAPLVISSIQKNGSHSSEFTIGGLSLPATVAAGTSQNFTVTYNPASIGLSSATLTVLSDDTDEASYAFAICGHGVEAWQEDILNVSFNTKNDVPFSASNVALNNSTLNFSLVFTPTVGTQLTVIRNTSVFPINGTFSNLEHGKEIALLYNQIPYYFVANYYGGDGNDLVLHWARTRPYGWGEATQGQLGNKTVTPDQTGPAAVIHTGALAGKTVLSLACGNLHTLALLSDGDVVAWGDDSVGQLGNDSTLQDSSVPVLVNNLPGSALYNQRVVAIAAGFNFSLALCQDKTTLAFRVVGWGGNTNGQLGDNSIINRPVPVAVNSSSTSALYGKTVLRIASGCSAYHSLALCADNITGATSLVAWGRNTIKCLGDNTTTAYKQMPVNVTVAGALVGKQVIQMTAGEDFSLALCSDSSIAAWGENASGRLGNGVASSLAASQTDAAIPLSTSISSLLSGSQTITAISAGQSHVVALRSDGKVISWGHNATNQGKLGTNKTITFTAIPELVYTNSTAPVSALSEKQAVTVSAGLNQCYALGVNESVPATPTSAMVSWGHNDHGRLGIGATFGTTAFRNYPVAVVSGAMTSDQRFISIAGGGFHAQALVASAPVTDFDQDGMPDAWEFSHLTGNDTFQDLLDFLAHDDADHDGLQNIDEWVHQTNPFDDGDSDNDDLPDYWEIASGLDPKDNTGINGRDGDFDSDNQTNLTEFYNNTAPKVANPNPNPGGGGSNNPETPNPENFVLSFDLSIPSYLRYEEVTTDDVFEPYRITGSNYEGVKFDNYQAQSPISSLVIHKLSLEFPPPPSTLLFPLTTPTMIDWQSAVTTSSTNRIYEWKKSQIRLHSDVILPLGITQTCLVMRTTKKGAAAEVRTFHGTVTLSIPKNCNISSPLWLEEPKRPSWSSDTTITTFLVPVALNCPELYMFGGHTNDVVELCKVGGIPCEWKFKNPTPVIGTFDHPTDTACSFTATTSGKNTIQLVVGGNVVWEKPTEVIEIVTRAGWGAVAPNAHTLTMPDFQHVTLHHTSNANTGAAEMQRIQHMHMSLFPYVSPYDGPFQGKNFVDIGYHFIMDKAGVVYEGRQLEAAPGAPGGSYTAGEHVGANNTVAGIGFCTMGDYEGTEGNETWPAARQKDLEKAVSALCRRYKLPAAKLSYHKALAVSPGGSLCPGSNYIPTIPDIIKHVTENLQ
ncbi:MAG: choice-of-anchor D domain-containing protein [Verrucomicrobiota bacterium]